jgi:DNA invertase Pin-like site-specific DNA recombinase
MIGVTESASKKAVAYYRHSAEDKQENSVAIQRQHAQAFAFKNGIEIIHEEADEGKSGLLANRPAFERLFKNWIENTQAPYFTYVLVYDVSRWGRFQDQDQAGYLVHLCKRNGKEVVYISRGFPDDSNPLISSLETSIHRYMAAEYSRQLSDKVFYGCVKVSEQGYSAGGIAAYGMARQLLDVNKMPIRILNIGDHKQIANERVTFTPKNDQTTDAVKIIFSFFVEKWLTITRIATYLNDKGILSANGKQWNKSKVVRILTNETYTGTRIYNKTWGRLKQKLHKNPRSEWVVVQDAFSGIVEKEIFKKAQERLYWLFPRKWRKGVNAIKRAKSRILQDISKWLFLEGATECEVQEIVSELPIIFSVKNQEGDAALWCFLITEKTRQYSNALAISVVPNLKKVIEDLFFFSIDDFTNTNFLIFSDKSSKYNDFKIESGKVEDTVKTLIKQIRDCKLRNSQRYRFINNW